MNRENDVERPLRILHVEDSPRDAEIIRERLNSAGFSFHLDWACNEQEFITFLQTGEYDLVLADYELSGFDAPAALRLLKFRCPDVPFICVSGAIGEETAVELLKLGAVDYVIKDRLQRLPFSIKRAIDEAREKESRIRELTLAQEEKLLLEQQFQQAQKLESLGILAGGIAHDFNNILTVIICYSSLILQRPAAAEELIPEIEKAATRAAELCRQMLVYAGKAQPVPTKVKMTALVDEMVKMLKATINQNVVITPDLSADIPAIKADASQIRQVVMNLIINAAEAIGEAQGEIRVSLARTEIRAGHADRDHLGKIIMPGQYLCLVVTDNGCGMTDETKRRIFEPFYTTKFTGRGLGMSAVLGIITAHHGALQLFSQPDKGTAFKVYLPVQGHDVAGDDAFQHVPAVQWQGSGTVLLVEDEEPIRFVSKTMLKALGFTVMEASNGKEALEVFEQNSGDITLVVTDMGMPVMDGYALFLELKKINPDMPIIICSGFGDTVVFSRIAEEETAGFIHKPYSFDQLRNAVRGVMEQAKGES